MHVFEFSLFKRYIMLCYVTLCYVMWKSFSCVWLGIFQARILEWVAVPFSTGSSQPRYRTQVSHIAGGFFTSWATREVVILLHKLLLIHLPSISQNLWMCLVFWVSFSILFVFVVFYFFSCFYYPWFYVFQKVVQINTCINWCVYLEVPLKYFSYGSNTVRYTFHKG